MANKTLLSMHWMPIDDSRSKGDLVHLPAMRPPAIKVMDKDKKCLEKQFCG